MGTVRQFIRLGHICGGLWIAIFVFSPLRLDPTATLFAQLGLVALSISGLVLWQLPRLARRFKGQAK